MKLTCRTVEHQISVELEINDNVQWPTYVIRDNDNIIGHIDALELWDMLIDDMSSLFDNNIIGVRRRAIQSQIAQLVAGAVLKALGKGGVWYE